MGTVLQDSPTGRLGGLRRRRPGAASIRARAALRHLAPPPAEGLRLTAGRAGAPAVAPRCGASRAVCQTTPLAHCVPIMPTGVLSTRPLAEGVVPCEACTV